MPSQPPLAAAAFDPWLFVATCGGIGRIPRGPGTFGSLVGIPLSLATGEAATWLAAQAAASTPSDGVTATCIEGVLVGLVCAAGVPICSQAATRLGRGKDPGAIVLDEAAALPITLLVVPPAARSPVVFLVAFALFRLFDIWKPTPCRQLERLPEGLGIMADDWGAAAWAGLCLAIARALVAGDWGTG